jgi:NTP pyrophosphatase (non-canonical NTP hydrolase)
MNDKLYCPQCGGEVIERERRPDGRDTCVNDHYYPSKLSRPACPRDNDGDGNCGDPTCVRCRQRQYGLRKKPPVQFPFFGGADGLPVVFGTQADPLSLDTVQAAVEARSKVWAKGNDLGLLYHSTELGGEAGEALNECKKLVRHWHKMVGNNDRNETEIREAIGSEIADVVICAAKLASYLGLSLDSITASKFNKTSEKNGFAHRIAAPDVELKFGEPVKGYAEQDRITQAWAEKLNLDPDSF